MASVTAEVMLYFATDDPKLKEVVDKLRFDYQIDDTRTIINLIGPIWSLAYDAGYMDGGGFGAG